MGMRFQGFRTAWRRAGHPFGGPHSPAQHTASQTLASFLLPAAGPTRGTFAPCLAAAAVRCPHLRPHPLWASLVCRSPCTRGPRPAMRRGAAACAPLLAHQQPPLYFVDVCFPCIRLPAPPAVGRGVESACVQGTALGRPSKAYPSCSMRQAAMLLVSAGAVVGWLGWGAVAPREKLEPAAALLVLPPVCGARSACPCDCRFPSSWLSCACGWIVAAGECSWDECCISCLLVCVGYARRCKRHGDWTANSQQTTAVCNGTSNSGGWCYVAWPDFSLLRCVDMSLAP